MPFAKLSREQLDRVAHEVLAALQRADLHPIPQTQGLTFSDIERTAHAVGQRVAACITADALANAAEEQAEFAACPQCAHRTRVTRKKRDIHTLDGPVDYKEPAAHCVGCRRDFFPSASPTALG
jgi:Zn ribbon nucleic-acid-binding protein